MRPDRPEFTFVLFEQEVAKYSPDIPVFETKWEKYSFFAGFSGALIAYLGVFLPVGNWKVVLVVGGFILELAAFAVLVTIIARREWQSLRNGKINFARDMDADYSLHRKFIEWLRGYPSPVLRGCLGYVRRRGERMKRKLGLLSGGVERLGILPLLAALFLQFRSFKWEGIPNYLELLAALVLIALYGIGWWSVLTTLRLDTYEMLLADALDDDFGVKSASK
ncbi:hypothetical protein [Arenimonas oryziterrae]|uniref:Uncharacterized protein n=1 Tax=Arenimonas oryziterrae DSM 21050 = YC6267 TaxID=1121015 RepID=A0A091ALI1_9GAMM|nr:hypothetical protein [Arenimonas oryziterrae]KFN41038.1 hypothetical protein N789_03915 [Arenimonas oryziterrae DSM 21050 = YC6267]